MDNPKDIVLPDLLDKAVSDKFADEVFQLAELLMNTINDQFLARFEADETLKPPTAQALGSAIYCALRMSQLNYAVEDPRYKAVRDGFMATFALNDDEWRAMENEDFLRDNEPIGSA